MPFKVDSFRKPIQNCFTTYNVLWQCSRVLHLQVNTFFKNWLNTCNYYHNTYEYWAGEDTLSNSKANVEKKNLKNLQCLWICCGRQILQILKIHEYPCHPSTCLHISCIDLSFQMRCIGLKFVKKWIHNELDFSNFSLTIFAVEGLNLKLCIIWVLVYFLFQWSVH